MHWLSFFIGALLGWLVGWLIDLLICRPRRGAAEAALRDKLDNATKESAALQAQLSAHKDLQARLDGARRETETLRAQLAAAQDQQTQLISAKDEIARLNADLAAARTGAGIGMSAPVPPVAPDDLTVIEGIGPRIAELLAEDGIRTFAELVAATPDRLRAILDAGGTRFRTADPTTWPEQAILARDGQWDAFKALQDAMKGGRRV